MQVLPKTEEALIANTLFTSAESFGIIVESSSGIPIVSGIELASGPNGSPGKESPGQEILVVPNDSESIELPVGRESGLSIAPGMPNGSRNWLLVLPDIPGEVVVAVENTTSSGVTALISRYGERQQYEVQLAAFAIQHLRLAAGNTIEVRSESEVVVAAVHQEPNGAGLSLILGIRFAEGG